jgi:CheY-like chemotaxis protein
MAMRTLFGMTGRDPEARFLKPEPGLGNIHSREDGVIFLASDVRRETNEGGAEPGLRPIEILVADESPGERRLIETLAEELSVPVNLRWADSGERTLAHFSDGTCQTGHLPDLLLIDPVLPGLDGWEVISQLRRDGHGESLRVAVMVPQPSDYMVRRCQELGIEIILEKPVTAKALERLIEGL